MDARVTSDVVREMRGWLEDCGIDTRFMGSVAVVKRVAALYEGGLEAFLETMGEQVPSMCDPLNDPSSMLEGGAA